MQQPQAGCRNGGARNSAGWNAVKSEGARRSVHQQRDVMQAQHHPAIDWQWCNRL
jgi:hypothetical protein